MVITFSITGANALKAKRPWAFCTEVATAIIPYSTIWGRTSSSNGTPSRR